MAWHEQRRRENRMTLWRWSKADIQHGMKCNGCGGSLRLRLPLVEITHTSDWTTAFVFHLDCLLDKTVPLFPAPNPYVGLYGCVPP